MNNKDVLKQYCDTGLKIPEYQCDKLNRGLLNTYLRKRLISYKLHPNDDDNIIELYEFVKMDVITQCELNEKLNFIFYQLPKTIVDNMMTHNELLKNTKIISNNYYLMENGYITKEDFAKKYPLDVELKDDVLYLKFYGEISDLDFMFDDSRNASSKDVIKSLNDNDYMLENTDFKDLYLSDLTNKSEEDIKKKIAEIKEKSDNKEEFDEYNNWEKQIENIDDLDELKSAIENAFRDAQESANSSEMWFEATKPLLYFFGMDKIMWFDNGVSEESKNNNSGLLVKIDRDWLIRYDKNGNAYYKKQLAEGILRDWFEEKEDEDEHTEEHELLEIDIPYYGWSGDIDPKELEEIISDKLYDIK